jgi:hypothetical protein
VLTIISLPVNAGTAARTNDVGVKLLCPYRSLKRLERELRSTSARWEFQPVLRTSLSTFIEVLSSFTAFMMLRSIICKKGVDVKGGFNIAHFKLHLTGLQFYIKIHPC